MPRSITHTGAYLLAILLALSTWPLTAAHATTGALGVDWGLSYRATMDRLGIDRNAARAQADRATPPQSVPMQAAIDPAIVERIAQEQLPIAASGLPTWIEPNVGQADPQVRFLSRVADTTAYFTADGLTLELPLRPSTTTATPKSPGAGAPKPDPALPTVSPAAAVDAAPATAPTLPAPTVTSSDVLSPTVTVAGTTALTLTGQLRPQPAVVQTRFVGANPSPRIRGGDSLLTTVNYLIGPDPAAWHTQVPTFGSVVYEQLYPGIDLTYASTATAVKSTYTVAPGADPAQIRWQYAGALTPSLASDGSLVLPLAARSAGDGSTAAAAQLQESAPLVWQETAQGRVPIGSRYRVAADGVVSFDLAAYDRTQPLIIDPALSYISYVGGANADNLMDVAYGTDGSIYMTGDTDSASFVTFPSPTRPWTNSQDVIVAKLDPTGVVPVYVSYIGGSTGDYGMAIAVETSGNVVVGGYTNSTNFPLQNAYQTTLGGNNDAFVLRLSATGASVLASTYLGGSLNDVGIDMALWVDGGGTPWAYLAGETLSSGFPISGTPYDAACAICTTGGRKGFLAKIDLTASVTLAYSTFLGGSTPALGQPGTTIFGIAVDSSGVASVVGQTTTTDFPLKQAFQTTHSGGLYEGFITTINPANSGANDLIASTYFGGGGADCERGGDTRECGIAIDSSGALYIAGYTASTNLFSTTAPPPSADLTYNGGATDGFVIKVSATTPLQLLYGSYLGGSGDDGARSVAIRTTSGNEAVVAGETASSNFPAATALTTRGGDDSFIVRLNAAGSSLVEQQVLGGTGNERVGQIAVSNPLGYVALAGQTTSTNLVPQQYAGGRSTYIGGTTDGFIALYGTSATFVPSAQVNTASAKDANCTCNTPHPVNTRTGNFWTTATDLVLEGMGPTIAWARTYSAQARTTQGSANMPLGAGWFHRYSDRLEFTTGIVTLVTADGNRLRFVRTAPGVYAADPGVHRVMTDNGTTYTLVNRDTSIETYNASGQLTGFTDPQGQALTFSYTSGRLTQITDAINASRYLAIDYTDFTATGRIATVRDGVSGASATRSIAFTYTAANNLDEVTQLTGFRTKYGYDTAPRIASISLVKTGVPTRLLESVVYDGSDRVSQQTLEDGRGITFGYQVTLDGSTPIGATTTYTTTQLGQTRVARHVYGANGALQYVAQGASIAALQTTQAAAYDGAYNAAAVSDGVNVTYRRATAQGRITQETDGAGGTTTRTYTPENRIAEVVDPVGIRTTYAYDGLGNVISTTTRNPTQTAETIVTLARYQYRQANGTWGTSSAGATGSRIFERQTPEGVITRYLYTDPADGMRVTEIQTQDAAATMTALRTGYTYDAVGRVIQTTTGLGTALQRIDTSTYNSDGSIAQTIQNKIGTGTVTYDPAFPDRNLITTYRYDSWGRSVGVQDTLGRWTVTTYTGVGQVASTIQNPVPVQFDAATGAFLVNGNTFTPQFPDQNVVTSFTYDALGRQVDTIETGFLGNTYDPALVPPRFTTAVQRTTRTTYDSLGRVASVIQNYQSGIAGTNDVNVTTTTTYDAASNVYETTTTLAQSGGVVQQQRVVRMIYDGSNRVVQEIVNPSADGVPSVGPKDEDNITRTQYDAAGRTMRVTRAYDPSTPAITTDSNQATETTYDALGRVTQTVAFADAGASAMEINRTTLMVYRTNTTQVLATRDSLGQWTRTAYDGLGRTVQTISPCVGPGGTATVPPTTCDAFSDANPNQNVVQATAYDALGRAFQTSTTITAATARVARTEFDGVGRTSATVANYVNGTYTTGNADEDVRTTFTYNGLGQQLSRTQVSFTGDVTTMAYDALGRMTSQTDAVGRTTTVVLDASGTARRTVTPDGRVMITTLDGLGRTTATIANFANGVADGGDPADVDLITQTTLDAAGRTTGSIDAGGRLTTMTYDKADRLTGVVENARADCAPTLLPAQLPCNVTTTYAYDLLGNRLTTTDPRANVWQSTYNRASEEETRRDPGNIGPLPNERWLRDAGGRPLFVHDGQREFLYRYTTAGTLASIADQPGTVDYLNVATDARGLRTRIGATLSDPAAVRLQYDRLDRLTQQTRDGTTTEQVAFSYNRRGDQTGITYPGALAVAKAYNADRTLATVSEGGTTRATYRYDTAGRMVQLATSEGGVTTYAYDRADRVRSVRSTLNGSLVSGTTYTMRRDGKRTQVDETLPTAPTIASTRLATLSFEGQTLLDTFTAASSVSGTLQLVTNAPLDGAAAFTTGAVAGSYVTKSLTSADNLAISMLIRLDAAPTNSVTVLELRNGSTRMGGIQITSGRTVKLILNGVQVGSTSTALTLGQVYRIGVIQQRQVGATANGVLEAHVVALTAPFTTSGFFARTTTAAITSGVTTVRVGSINTVAISAAFDEVAIDTTTLAPPPITTPTRTIAYGYDGLGRLIGATESGTGAVSATYAYDLVGNRTSATIGGTTTTTSYSADNRIVGVTYDGAGRILNDGTTTATYNELGQLTGRTVTATSVATTYASDADGVLVGQTMGGTTTRYVQDRSAALPQVLRAAGSTNYVYGAERLYGVTGGARTWELHDGLGSVRRTTSGTTVSAPISYDASGQVRGGATLPRFGYTGELQDAATGHVYLRARWYNAASGRFGSRDPYAGEAEEPQSLHRYAYVHNDPVNATDPSGLVRWFPTGGGWQHDWIENQYELRDPIHIHVEFNQFPGVPVRHSPRIDLLNDATGDVYDIKPIHEMHFAIPQVTGYIQWFKIAQGFFALEPIHPTGTTYHWNSIFWHYGSSANYPPQRWPLSSGFYLVAMSPLPATIVYWLEPADASAAAWERLSESRYADKAKRPFGWQPGMPVPALPADSCPPSDYARPPSFSLPPLPGSSPPATAEPVGA